MRYDYKESMKQDILEYMRENEDMWEELDIDTAEEVLFDSMWCADEVTGNGSGSYTFNRWIAKDYFLGDENSEEYFSEAVHDYDISAEEVGRRFIESDYEWFDVTIRCFLLGSVLRECLEEVRGI